MIWIPLLKQIDVFDTDIRKNVPILPVDDSSHNSQQLHGSSLCQWSISSWFPPAVAREYQVHSSPPPTCLLVSCWVFEWYYPLLLWGLGEQSYVQQHTHYNDQCDGRNKFMRRSSWGLIIVSYSVHIQNIHAHMNTHTHAEEKKCILCTLSNVMLLSCLVHTSTHTHMHTHTHTHTHTQ